MLSEVLDLDIVQRHVDSLYPEIEQGDDWEVLIVLKEFRALIAELRASRKVVEAARAWANAPFAHGHFVDCVLPCQACDREGELRQVINARSEEK